MTTEQIRIAVAEEMGTAAFYAVRKEGYYYRPNAHGYTSRIEEAGRYSKEEARRHLMRGEVMDIVPIPPPDYPNDLNACAEFEATLSEKEVAFYLTKLLLVRYRTGADHGMIACMQDKLAFATARERCEAFLRLRGKWKEDEK